MWDGEEPRRRTSCRGAADCGEHRQADRTFDFLDRNQRWSAPSCGETRCCCWLGPIASLPSDPPSHPESKGPGEVAALPRVATLLFSGNVSTGAADRREYRQTARALNPISSVANPCCNRSVVSHSRRRLILWAGKAGLRSIIERASSRRSPASLWRGP